MVVPSPLRGELVRYGFQGFAKSAHPWLSSFCSSGAESPRSNWTVLQALLGQGRLKPELRTNFGLEGVLGQRRLKPELRTKADQETAVLRLNLIGSMPRVCILCRSEGLVSFRYSAASV